MTFISTPNGEYSRYIRPCAATSNNPLEEPGSHAWADENSVSDGYLTLHKTFYFTLKDLSSGSLFWDGAVSPFEIPPSEVLRSSGFPQKWERLAEDTNYHYTGNGTLRHLSPTSRIWAFDAEYTSKNETDSDGYSRDDKTPPWKRKPTNVSIELDEIEGPLTVGYDKNNRRFKPIVDDDIGNIGYLVRQASNHNIIRNTAGDPINGRGTRYVTKVNFTYCLKPNDFSPMAIINKNGSVNKSRITVINIEIPAGCGRIVRLQPQLIDDWDSGSFHRKTPYWEIQVSIQLAIHGESFNQKLMNCGNRAKFHKGFTISDSGEVTQDEETKLVVDDVFAWRTWDLVYGQMLGNIQYGCKEMLVNAKKLYKKKTDGKELPDFTYEQMQSVPLTENGFIDKDALDPNSERFGDYLMIEPLTVPREDWAHLNMPEKGVKW